VEIPRRRIDAGVDRDRHVERDGGGEEDVVRGMPVRDAAAGERQQESAARTGRDRALELTRRELDSTSDAQDRAQIEQQLQRYETAPVPSGR